MVVLSFFFVIFNQGANDQEAVYLNQPQAYLNTEERQYVGLNTEELQEFSKRSKSSFLKKERSRKHPQCAVDESITEAHALESWHEDDDEDSALSQRWVTDDECAICCSTLKDT